MTQKF